MSFADEDHTIRRIWMTPPELFKAGGIISMPIMGKKFLIRTDFPVRIFFDGKEVGFVGQPFVGHYRVNISKLENSPRMVTFRFPVGFGENQAGALVQGQLLGRHGTCCIDASWSDEDDPQLPNPDMLPACNFSMNHLNVSAENFPQLWGTVTNLNIVFQVGSGGPVPNEIYVKSVSLDLDLASISGSIESIYAYRWLLFKANTPAGDRQNFIIVTPTIKRHSFTVPMNNLKIPLRSVFAQWAAETPNLNYEYYGTQNNVVGIAQAHARLNASYIF